MKHVVIIFLLSLAAFAQTTGSCVHDILLTRTGQPAAGGTVRVCSASASGPQGACSPLITIYADSNLTQTIANPTHADQLGNYTFCANAGHVTIDFTYGSTIERFLQMLTPTAKTPPTSWTSPLFVDDGATAGIVGEYSPQRGLRLTRIRVKADQPWLNCQAPATLTVTVPGSSSSPDITLATLSVQAGVRPNVGSPYPYVLTAETALSQVVNAGQQLQMNWTPAAQCGQYPNQVTATVEYDGAP